MNARLGRRRYRSRVEHTVAAIGVVAVFRAAFRALRRQSVPAAILSAAVAAPILVEAVSPVPPSYVPFAPIQALSGILGTIMYVRFWPDLPGLSRAGIVPPYPPGWLVLFALCELLYAAALTVAGAALLRVLALNRRGDELTVLRALRALRARFRPLGYAALVSGITAVFVLFCLSALMFGLKPFVSAVALELVADLAGCASVPLFLVPLLGFAFAVLYDVDAVNALKLAWRFAIERLAYTWILGIALLGAYLVPMTLVELAVGYLAKNVPDAWLLVWRLVRLVVSVALFVFLTAAVTAAAGGYWRQRQRH